MVIRGKRGEDGGAGCGSDLREWMDETNGGEGVTVISGEAEYIRIPSSRLNTKR